MPAPAERLNSPTTIDPAEVGRFEAAAEAWWDPEGAFAPLHKLNPLRTAYIRDAALRHFDRSGRDIRPFRELRLLDVGCGGGLLSEPMARLGAEVTGLDAAPRNIGIAAAHADESGLAIDYRSAPVEALANAGAQYDIVLAMEIVEHVADLDAFVAAAAACVAPGGLVFVSTINRTAKAFALAILGAEYVLRWLPRGTHRWSKFVRPSELVRSLAANGLMVEAMNGVAYDPLADSWHLGRDLSVNYMLYAARPQFAA